MNTPKSFQLSFVLSTALSLVFLLTTSCEKETFMPETDTLTNTIQEAEYDPIVASLQQEGVQETSFSFELIDSDCIASGKTYDVRIDAPEKYGFVWTLNSRPASHSSTSPSCLCNGTATVFVTRLKDKLTIQQTVELPSCDSDIVYVTDRPVLEGLK